MIDHPDPITRLVRACEPAEPVAPTDPRYVNCDDVRGKNLVQLYERSLRRADPARPEAKLFAGHRGVGKTSELLRLKAALERPESEDNPNRPFQVVFFDVSRLLDVNDLDFPDLLVCTAAEVQSQLRDASIPGFSAASTYLQRVWDDIRGLLKSEVTVSEAGLDAGYASLTVELRNRPSARQQLRKAIETHSTSLLKAVNDLLQTATVKLRAAGREGLVLIIDGLDKLERRPLEDGRTNTHERLFIDRSERLTSLDAHTIYTVPISLIYSPRYVQSEQVFGEATVPVPMIPVRGAGRSEPTPDTPGMSKLWEILAARCAYAEVDIADVFDCPETGHYLCQMTGGHPRHLMTFMKASAAAVDTLPITRAGAEYALNNSANALLREVPDRVWPKLQVFATPQNDIPKDDDHQQMLLLLHVFEYLNERPWYEVNPVFRTLDKFRSP